MNSLKQSLGLMKWGDFVVVGVTLAVCALLWGNLVAGFSDSGRKAEIVAGGITILRFDMETGAKEYESEELESAVESFSEEKMQDGEIQLHVVSQGVHFDILFHEETVRFSTSDCPDKICVQTGPISKTGQVAACVPARVLIRITGGAKSGENDVVIR